MKKIFLIIGISIIFILLVLFFGLYYVSQKTNRVFWYFPKTILESVKQRDVPSNLNIIILGLDRRNDWLEKTEATDTIIYAHYNLSETKIHLFSLPRDLWNYFTSTKINQIYPKSLEKINNKQKFDYITDNFASISGQPINRVLVLSTEDIKQLADIMGGIDITLEKGFKDEKYPNDDYILNPKSGVPIYKTVEFKSGLIHLDSSNITEFVRSRKSAETAESGGTDLGRIDRQQQLINALIDKVKNDLPKNPQLVFKLYEFWSNLEHNFTDTELISYFIKYGTNLVNTKIIRHPISSGENPKENILYHPTKFINSQWVFIPQDKDYKLLHQFITQSLVSF